MEIREEPLGRIDEYSRIPIVFEVDTVLDVEVRDSGLGGFELRQRHLSRPFVKDYDAIPGNHPADLEKRFDLACWGLLLASINSELVGGVLLAFNTPGVDMLEDRHDLAVVWDIRVAPNARRQGIGSALFAAAERWAMERGCRWLKVETQNVNVPACMFYVGQGCILGAVHRFAYRDLPDEAQLLWYKKLR